MTSSNCWLSGASLLASIRAMAEADSPACSTITSASISRSTASRDMSRAHVIASDHAIRADHPECGIWPLPHINSSHIVDLR